MRAGRLIRQAQRLEAADARACEECGHPMGEHFELKPKIVFREGVITETPHPDYKPGVFHCQHLGCTCAVDLLAARGIQE